MSGSLPLDEPVTPTPEVLGPSDEPRPGWRNVPLGSIGQIVMGQSPPGTAVLDWDRVSRKDGGLPFVQGNAEFGPRFPAPVKWCSQPIKVVQPGDVLISVRAPVGHTNRADRTLAIGRGLAAIRFTHADPSFGWHALNHAKSAFGRVAQGSTFDAIGSKELLGLSIFLPAPDEQRAIARILDAIDEAIECTGELIATTETLRKALLHELLSRGVPGWHTEWKQVPGLGTIPASWSAVPLGHVGKWLSGGTPSKANPNYWRGAIPWVSPKDMKSREICESIDHISQDAARKESKIAPPDSILLVVRGMILAHSFPLAVTRTTCAFNQDIRALVCGDGLSPGYVLAALEAQRPRLLQLPTPSTHGTMRVVADQLFNVLVPVPEPAEQEFISDVFSAIESELEAARAEAQRLLAASVSAGEELLTGRRRIGAPQNATPKEETNGPGHQH